MVAKATPENMSDDMDITVTVPESLRKYYLQDRVELDEALSYDEAMERALAVTDELTLLGSGARVAPKEELINRPFFIRSFRFQESSDYLGTFAIVNLVTKDTDENLIITDGSSGIMAQLEREAERRLKGSHPTPFEFVLVPNGLRVSEYSIDQNGRPLPKGEKGVGRGRTFYLA